MYCKNDNSPKQPVIWSITSGLACHCCPRNECQKAEGEEKNVFMLSTALTNLSIPTRESARFRPPVAVHDQTNRLLFHRLTSLDPMTHLTICLEIQSRGI
jgi:hypothetical protein